MTRNPLIPLFTALMLCAGLPATAQTAPTDVQTAQPAQAAGKPDCDAAKAEPATQETAGADGTAPSNSGSTGWSGGTGGSQIGTNTAGATAASKTWQPPTARGLDLRGQPEPAAAC